MESKPTRVNEDYVQPQAQQQVQQQQQPQQQQIQPKAQPQSAAPPQFHQVPVARNPGQPVNQNNTQNIITRRPSITYTGENIVRVPAPPPTLQRIDSRLSVIPAPPQPVQPQQYQTAPQSRPVQQQQSQPSGQQQQQQPQQPQPRLVQQLSQQQFQPPKQPLHPQPQPVHQQPQPLQAQNHQQQSNYQQRPPGPQYQQPRPELVTRRPSIQQIQGPLISQPNRPLAVPNQYQQPGQQSHQAPPLQHVQQNRPIAPTQNPVQHLSSVQSPQIKTAPPPQSFSRSPTPQGQGQTQQLNQPHSGPPSDLNRINPGQYRVQNPYQAQPIRPVNPQISNNIARLQEERRKMSAEINPITENKQPSYIISNSDDVDDVIVRPISQSSILSNQSDSSAKAQPVNNENRPSPQPQVPKPQPATVEPNKPNYQSSVLRNITAEQNAPPPVGRVPLEKNDNVPAPRQQPTPAARKPADDASRNQNGTSTKATEKVADEPGSRTTSHSRASSHKSQEDIPQRSSSRSRLFKIEKPEEPVKKVPMNKVRVGNAPPPNLKQVRSKIGSLDNATHKPGGGRIKIETKKLEFHVQPRIEAKNDAYQPKGSDKKIISTKLQWNAKSKIGSLDNASHKPGGGDKKILNLKSSAGENANPKVGSKSNTTTTSNGAATVSSESAKP